MKFFKRLFCSCSDVEIVKLMETPFQLIWDERCRVCGHVENQMRTISVHVERKKYNPIGVIGG